MMAANAALDRYPTRYLEIAEEVEYFFAVDRVTSRCVSLQELYLPEAMLAPIQLFENPALKDLKYLHLKCEVICGNVWDFPGRDVLPQLPFRLTKFEPELHSSTINLLKAIVANSLAGGTSSSITYLTLPFLNDELLPFLYPIASSLTTLNLPGLYFWKPFPGSRAGVIDFICRATALEHLEMDVMEDEGIREEFPQLLDAIANPLQTLKISCSMASPKGVLKGLVDKLNPRSPSLGVATLKSLEFWEPVSYLKQYAEWKKLKKVRKRWGYHCVQEMGATLGVSGPWVVLSMKSERRWIELKSASKSK